MTDILDNDVGEFDNIYDDIHEVEKKLDDITNHINELWDNVIVSYINNLSSNQVLTCLTEDDRLKFLKFMMDKSPICNTLTDHLKDLYETVDYEENN